MLWGKETHRFRTRKSVERDVRNELRALPHHDLREAAFLGVDDACW